MAKYKSLEINNEIDACVQMLSADSQLLWHQEEKNLKNWFI